MKRKLGPFLPISSLLAVGCQAPTPPQADAEPRGEAAKVLIPRDGSQARALAIADAREERPAPLHFDGRPAWDAGISVRVDAPFGGRVADVAVAPGQRVDRGAVLARIASSDYAQAESDERKAASGLRLAERTLTRVRDLQEHGAAALKELEAAEAEHAAARSEDQRARARLAAYGNPGTTVDGSFALRAPIGGGGGERNLSPGQEVRNDGLLLPLAAHGTFVWPMEITCNMIRCHLQHRGHRR
jgi:membrane fusion protein, heavy metal efflux system